MLISLVFDESVTNRRTDRPTDRPTDRRMDRPSYRDARTHLKSERKGKCLLSCTMAFRYYLKKTGQRLKRLLAVYAALLDASSHLYDRV